jgi:hypothetical protein
VPHASAQNALGVTPGWRKDAGLLGEHQSIKQNQQTNTPKLTLLACSISSCHSEILCHLQLSSSSWGLRMHLICMKSYEAKLW